MSEIETLTKVKDNAYWERNQLVSALSKVFPAHLAKHPEDDGEWEEDWRTIVVIKLPLDKCRTPLPRGYECVHTFTDDRNKLISKASIDPEMHLQPGEVVELDDNQKYYQLSWHIHDTDVVMFDHLTYECFEWDGHSNEDKYRRLRSLKQKK